MKILSFMHYASSVIVVAVYFSFTVMYFHDVGDIHDNKNYLSLSSRIYASTFLIATTLLMNVFQITFIITKLLRTCICTQKRRDKDWWCLYITKLTMTMMIFTSVFITFMCYLAVLECFVLKKGSSGFANICYYDPSVLYEGWGVSLVLFTLMINVFSLPYVAYSSARMTMRI